MDQKKVWDSIALPWKEFRNVSQEKVEEFIKDKSGKILDLGCGSGRNFIKKDGLDWYGGDFSPKMIDLAKETLKEKDLGANLKVCEAWSTSFPDSFFDSILFNAVLHCIDSKEKRKATLEEIKRILRPGGFVFLSVWSRNNKRIKNKEKEGFIPWTSKSGEKFERYTYIYEFDELKNLIEEIGFKIIESFEDENLNFVLKK